MATIYKVLGQSAPTAATPTTLYTVPAATSAVTSTLVACNRGAVDGTYRVAVRPGGETLANKHYIVFDVPLPRNSADAAVLGLSLAAGDVVTIYASNENFSFSLFGSELS